MKKIHPAVFLLIAFPALAGATDFQVLPGQSIQAAIDTAADGDRVLVHPGTYSEAIQLRGKRLEVRSTGGAAVTILDGAAHATSIVRAAGEPLGAVFAGFTLTNGRGVGSPSSYGQDFYGGAMHCGGGSRLRVEDCRFVRNGWNSGGYQNCTFGGAIYCGGAQITLVRCLLFDNFAWACGGATLVEGAGGLITFDRCTVVANTSTNFFGPQGGIGMANDGDVVVHDCIVWGNFGNQIDAFGAPYNRGCVATVTWSCVQNGFPGTGNLALDPRFVSPAALDYGLQANSPCIDAGDPAAALDFDGTRRDLGAYAVVQVMAPIAPTLTIQPQPQVLTAPGGTATFSVVASGSSVLTYQWARNGVPITGATNATLSLANVQPAAVGSYKVTVSNAGGSVRSAGAALEIRQAGHAAAHAAPLGGYVAGRAVTVTSTLSYTGTPSALSWSVLLPAGWTFGAASSTGAAVAPVIGQTEVIDWAWSEIPASPVVFSYTLNVPVGDNGVVELVALAGVRGTVTQQFLAQPDPLSLNRLVTHLADTDRNFRIGLLELTRVIELYNIRNGSVRTGAYGVATAATEDGFVTAPERTSGTLMTLSVHHSADSDRDGRIALLELTRVIELYNYRSGGGRTGQYRVLDGTEDGFAPGP
jgi:hypothetical protein